jgi:hypothetical protein
MRQSYYIVFCFVVVLLVGLSGCSDVDGDDYDDAPTEIQDGELDYQDYKEAGCPYLGDSLDQETMEKCNDWIREQQDETQSDE